MDGRFRERSSTQTRCPPPLTPIIDTIRGLLLGTPIGSDWLVAIAWCVAITVYGFFHARAIYNREPGRV